MKISLDNKDENSKKQSISSATDLEKKLVEMIRFKKKLSNKKAKIIMTLDDLKSFDRSMEDHEKSEWILPQFFVQDIQRVILYCLIGTQYRFFPRWCKILRPNHIKRVHLITVNNLSELEYKTYFGDFKKFLRIFTNKNEKLESFEFVNPQANGSSFIEELSRVPITNTQWIKIRDEDEFKKKQVDMVKKYQKVFNKLKQKDSIEAKQFSLLDKICRTSLLLSAAQMVREDYPLPFDKSGTHSYDDYVYTSEKYKPVSKSSPLFSIDCEMCYNEDGEMEPMWLALVNENLECVYETFIKPKKRIRNYLTHITGVCAETFKGVTVELEHVQKSIKEILPPDAILCGQSLNNDLHSIKMFHPYVIDTSVVYNLSGNREIKPSLKRLAAQFLGKLIQEGSHNPSIDAKTAIQLVLLKLRQGIDFGDVIVNGCVNVYDENVAQNFHLDDIDMNSTASISKFIYKTGLSINQNFFNILRDNKISCTYIDDQKKTLDLKSDLIPRQTSKKFYDEISQIKEIIAESGDEQFLWIQLYYDGCHIDGQKNNSDKIKKLTKSIRKMYENLAEDSVFMVAFTGNETDAKELDKGRCFLKYKCTEMEELELKTKELYENVKNKDF